MKVKKWIFKSTILIPLLAAVYLFWQPFGIYIEEINFNLWYQILPFIFLSFTILWLRYSPCKYACQNGSLFELLFNLFPIEILLFFVFAQYNFIISLLIIIGIVILFLIFRHALMKDKKTRDLSERNRKMLRKVKGRFFLMLASALVAIPCLMAIFIYQLKDPVLEPNMELFPEISNSENEVSSDQIVTQSDAIFGCFKEETWTLYSPEEKITALQLLSNYEAKKLGMPSVSVTAERLNMFTLGSYIQDTNNICIDLQHLQDSSAESTAKTLLHELYHAYEIYVISNIDWESDFANSAYFAEARAWKENNSNYIKAVLDYDAYISQPLEASARDYAETESKEIALLING